MRHRAASRRGSTTMRPTRFRAMPRIWPRSAAPRPTPTHRSPAGATGRPVVHRSGEEQLPSPSFAFANKQYPIMQPKWPLLPELDARRYDPKAGPRYWPRHRRLAEPAGEVVDPPLELGTARERLGLV